MPRLGLAFKTFFRILRDAPFADAVRHAAEPQPAAPAKLPTVPPSPAPAVPAASPLRSDALTLLAVLQREARLVDFLKENLSAYNDAQIGAAVRDVHRDAAAALERIFALRPVMDQSEGSPVQVAADEDAHRVRLTGNVTGQPPFKGMLRHGGWQATQMQLPSWSGGPGSARIVAPAEVELS